MRVAGARARRQDRSIEMKIFDRLQSWIRAMEDIEEPVGAVGVRLRERIRILEAQLRAPSIAGTRDIP
jgi:predicted DNA-binding ArsR family transcriptional regulator